MGIYYRGQKINGIKAIQMGANLNIHYGLTAPEDTSKLWVVREEKPTSVKTTYSDVEGTFLDIVDGTSSYNNYTNAVSKRGSVTVGDYCFWGNKRYDPSTNKLENIATNSSYQIGSNWTAYLKGYILAGNAGGSYNYVYYYPVSTEIGGLSTIPYLKCELGGDVYNRPATTEDHVYIVNGTTLTTFSISDDGGLSFVQDTLINIDGSEFNNIYQNRGDCILEYYNGYLYLIGLGGLCKINVESKRVEGVQPSTYCSYSEMGTVKIVGHMYTRVGNKLYFMGGMFYGHTNRYTELENDSDWVRYDYTSYGTTYCSYYCKKKWVFDFETEKVYLSGSISQFIYTAFCSYSSIQTISINNVDDKYIEDAICFYQKVGNYNGSFTYVRVNRWINLETGALLIKQGGNKRFYIINDGNTKTQTTVDSVYIGVGGRATPITAKLYNEKTQTWVTI